MNTQPSPIPRSVAIISMIFAISALCVTFYSIQTLGDLIGTGPFEIKVMVVCLGLMAIGFPLWLAVGLWRLASDARIVVLCFCWFEFATIPFGTMAGFSIHPVGALALGIAQFALVLWIYRCLVHPDIRERFRI